MTPEPIAIVGAACRLPAAPGLDRFWRLLRDGQEALTTLTSEEMLAAGVTPDELADPDYVRVTMRAPDLSGFDAEFFGLPDAARCDPQARLFVEVAHAAIADAGHDVTAIGDAAGVFAAARPSRYGELHLRRTWARGGWEHFGAAHLTGESAETAAFTSAVLDLRGPSITIGSGSLHAVHLAAAALAAGECDVAVAGGSHVQIPDGHGYRWTPGAMRPPDGHTRPFDVAASGAVIGSGAGAVVLKRLSDAISDGDHVRAVISGSATAHRGIRPSASGAGGDGAGALAEAVAIAGPGPLDYVEAEGAALAAADRHEVDTLARGLLLAGVQPAPTGIPLGSVKANIGHLADAAGIAALLKAVLALRHERLPPTINVTGPHPALGMSESPFRLATAPEEGPVRRAAVHGVSQGGAVTALVLDRGPAPVLSGIRGRPQLVVWSAKDPVAADAAEEDLTAFLQRAATSAADEFADIAATLRQGRTAHPVRRARVGTSPAEAADAPVITAPRPVTASPGVVFDFPGLRDPQLLPRGLYGVVRSYTEAADVCLDAFERDGLDLYDRWLSGHADGEHAEALLFTAQFALTAFWHDLGVHPAEEPGTDRIVVQIDADVDESGLLAEAGRLWVNGVAVDFTRLEPGPEFQRLAVPGYPYQRTTHWVTPERGLAAPQHQQPSVQAPEVTATEVPGLPAPAEPLRPLGRTEHAFWILDQLAPDSGVSNIGIAFRTAKPLRWYPLQTAANQLLRRHPALRQRFPDVAGTPVRHLTAPADAQLRIDSATTTEEKLVSDLQQFLHRPFDLRHDLPFRLAHYTLPDGSSVVCFAAHHIVIDAPSVQILVEELGRIYDGITGTGKVPAGLTGEAPLLAEPEPDDTDVRYWLDELRGFLPDTMRLPGSRPPPASPTFGGHTCSWPMSEQAKRALAQLREQCRTTDNVVLMSAFFLTLLRHGIGPDLVVGVPVGTRRPATAQQVGYGVSTMPLRVRIDPAAGFAQLTERVGAAFFAGIEHAGTSVERVITARGHGTDDWRVPLFRHMFNYRPWSDEQIRICGEVPDYVEDLFDRSRLDLQCIAVPEPDRTTLRCWHSTEVHDEAEIAAFVARMQALLRRAADEPERPVAELAFPSVADQESWARVNRTERAWDGPGTVLGCIAQRAEAEPDSVAMADTTVGATVSYGELLGEAAAVRDLLRDNGVQPGQTVALALPRSVTLAAAMLGVWACGAAYLPLDPGQPAARLRGLVTDADAAVVLTADGTANWSPCPVLAPPSKAGTGPLLTHSAPDPGKPAYVIYTSGSTGTPKGVVVTHANLLNLVRDFGERLSSDAARVLWSTTPTFDISALELLVPLAHGGQAIVSGDDAALEPAKLLGLVREHDVRTVQATPTAWRLIVGAESGELAGRVLLCGGEPMDAALARQLRRRAGRVLNVYGPTETTIWSTAAELDTAPGDPVGVGAPIANTQVFVLDSHGRDLPPGVPGEVCIAGDGVSTGYLNRPELNAQRFGEHPRYGGFYRTGDVGLLRHDGTLELRGRDDRQVKVRGHRVELGEVESALHHHAEVAIAAVIQDGDTLRAFVQPASSADTTGLPERLWQHARGTLPDYAVPSGITVLDRLPATPNGKADYQALAERPAGHSPAAEHAPRAADPELTSALTGLWRDVLRRPELSADDNFFLNGGHSILAARIVGRIAEDTGHAVTVDAVFAHPTPARLAAYLTDSFTSAAPDAPEVPA